MRTYLHINLSDRTVKKEQMEGEQLARAGRYHIVKTMLDRGLADCDPLGPDTVSYTHLTLPTILLV